MAQTTTANPPARRTNISWDPDVIPLQDARMSGGFLHRTGTASSETHDSYFGYVWTRYIRITVPQKACRDHFALERTVLGYIRTSQAFAMLGVMIAQFMRLNNDGDPDPHFGFFKVSIPLSAACHGIAILVVVLGTIRFFRWQTTIAIGNSLSSGWEFLTTFVIGLVLLIVLFVLNLTISIERS